MHRGGETRMLRERALGERGGHEHDVGQPQFLVLAGCFFLAVLIAREGGGPFGFPFRLLDEQAAGGAPVADGQVVEIDQALPVRGREAAGGPVLVGVHARKTALVDAAGDGAVEAAVDCVDGEAAVLVPGEPRAGEASGEQARGFAPRTEVRHLPQFMRQGAAPHLGREAARQ